MAESDWDTVTVLRKKGPTAAQAKSKQAILAAQRRGEDVETSKKWAAGQNKQHSITKNTAKLDRETEELHHDRVTLEVGKVIQRRPLHVAKRKPGCQPCPGPPPPEPAVTQNLAKCLLLLIVSPPQPQPSDRGAERYCPLLQCWPGCGCGSRGS
uniref:Endothelial differentiation related factor 1 n=1 Tax=Rousettus aegyptiacus TaxID=9407 RepID=A0A7J8IHV1_ROUAE|nr:endothelial differentiation related factor 1 [Rousettus aegyptiacus]